MRYDEKWAVVADHGLGSLNDTVVEAFYTLDEAEAYVADPPFGTPDQFTVWAMPLIEDDR